MLVKNTVSGEVRDLPAEKTLGHPWFSQFYVPVTKNKNEVLAQPYEIVDGERRIIRPIETEAEVDQEAEAVAAAESAEEARIDEHISKVIASGEKKGKAS